MNHSILSKSKLAQSVAIALVIGIVLLLVAILPAEYGIDPTGVGKALGFSKLHVSSTTDELPQASTTHPVLKLEKAGSEPSVPRPTEADAPAPTKQYDVREDSIEITIPAGEGLEYKVYLLKYGQMKYEWVTDKGVLFFDFHGEVNTKQAAKDVYYESYTVAYSNNMIGTFLAPYEGKHGWYFKNNSDSDIKVALRLKGQYSL